MSTVSNILQKFSIGKLLSVAFEIESGAITTLDGAVEVVASFEDAADKTAMLTQITAIQAAVNGNATADQLSEAQDIVNKLALALQG
jgi:hypothetical protein